MQHEYFLKRSMPKIDGGHLARSLAVGGLMDSCAQLLVAAEDGDADTVRAELLAGADLDVRPDGETPLLLACRHEHRSVVELLCDAGADAAIADDDGWTPLHWAAALASPRLVELLLGAGSPVAAQANCGSTALLFATEVDDCESVRLLLQSGARPTQASWPARCTRGSSPLALALAGLPSQEHIEVGRLLAEAAGLAGAWAQKEAVLNDQVRDAARRRRESSFIGNALDDDVGRCVVSMLPLASLGAIAQSDKRWQSWAAPRLAQERIAAAARALVLRHLDGRSMASVAVADGRWARELARFLTTKHTDSFDPWDEIWDHSSPETLGLVLKSIALRMQAADLVEFFRACVDVQEVELYSAQANVGKAVLSVRDRKLGWTPELLVELMDVCNGFEPGSWWSLDSMPARATTPDSRHFFSPATCPVRLSSHPFSDAYYSALSARELFPSDLQKAGYLGLLRHSNAADVTPESNAFFLLSLHGDLLNTPGVTFSTDAARAAGALAAEAGLNAATVIATVQKIHDVVEEFHFEMSEANQPRPFCWARELLKGFCLWGSNGTHRKPTTRTIPSAYPTRPLVDADLLLTSPHGVADCAQRGSHRSRLRSQHGPRATSWPSARTFSSGPLPGSICLYQSRPMPTACLRSPGSWSSTAPSSIRWCVASLSLLSASAPTSSSSRASPSMSASTSTTGATTSASSSWQASSRLTPRARSRLTSLFSSSSIGRRRPSSRMRGRWRTLLRLPPRRSRWRSHRRSRALPP